MTLPYVSGGSEGSGPSTSQTITQKGTYISVGISCSSSRGLVGQASISLSGDYTIIKNVSYSSARAVAYTVNSGNVRITLTCPGATAYPACGLSTLKIE